MMLQSLIDVIGKKWLVLEKFLTANYSLNLITFHNRNEVMGLRGRWVESETQNMYTVHVFEDLLDMLEDKLELDLN